MNIPTMNIERNAALILDLFRDPSTCPPWGVRGNGLLFFPKSVASIGKGRKRSRMLIAQDAQTDYLVEISSSSRPDFAGPAGCGRSLYKLGGKTLSLLPLSWETVYELAESHLRWSLPSPIGNRKPSFGWGNRTPFSTQVVLATVDRGDALKGFNRVTAQNSIRENQILERHAGFRVVMADAVLGKIKMGFRGVTGSDADHLKTMDEIEDAIRARFTGYTLDPSLALKNTPFAARNGKERTVENIASDPGLQRAFLAARRRNRLPADYVEQCHAFLARRFAWTLAGDRERDANRIRAVAVKFGDSWEFMEKAFNTIRKRLGGREFDFEASFDETARPTDPIAHAITAFMLRRRKVSITRFAVRYVGRFEKTTPWIPPAGQGLSAFQKDYQSHQKIADAFGYLQSIHSGSGKYNIYRFCSRAHLKTSGDISRPLMIALAKRNFPAFCHLFHDLVDSATDTKKLYGAVSSHSNDFPLLHVINPQKLGQVKIVDKLENDILWRTFSHYAYGMFQKARGTFGELEYTHRDACAQEIARVLQAHRAPVWRANGIKGSTRKARLRTRG